MRALPDIREKPADPSPAGLFRRLVPAILERYLWQNSFPEVRREIRTGIAERLWELIAERGLPPPLAPEDEGAPGEIPENLTNDLVGRALEGVEAPARDNLALPVRHLVKAAFNPVFKNCRNSYREPSPDGSCRRQELPRALKRTSGSHCVDCPYWTSLTPAQHLPLLIKAWPPGALPLLAGRLDVFLPEDFRAYRLLIDELRKGPRSSP